MSDPDGTAPCIHLAVDDDGHGECLRGHTFQIDCRVLASGAIGCASYKPQYHLPSWAALALVHRWRIMREHYITRRAEFDRK